MDRTSIVMHTVFDMVYETLFVQIPSGWLADRVGGMWLLAGSMAVESVLAMLIPTAAHLHVGAVIFLRSLAGVFDGVQCPTAISLVAGIAPSHERSRVVGFIMSGTSFGAIVGMLVAGVLCDHAGWPWVFYTFGLTGCAWTAAWVVVTRGHRSSMRRQSATGQVLRRHTPWRRILTSRQVWACAAAYAANMWGFVTSLTCLPMYLSDVFGYGMTENGVFSMLPYVADGIMLVLSGQLADLLLRSARWQLSTGFVRKTISVVGLLTSGLFIILPGALGCHRVAIIVCLVTSVGMIGFSMPNVAANTMDLSPSDAGTLMGLSNAVSNAVSILAPLVVGALTYGRSTRLQWTKVFAIVAAIDVAGAAVFVVFGSGRRQDWAATNVDELADAAI